jgi:lipopolysaccharide transport system ATP-binding protein
MSSKSTPQQFNASTDGEIAIKIEHVSKKYCKSLKRSMLYGVEDIGRNIVGLHSRSHKVRKNEFWAIDDVSFEVRKGETLGIIGPNGAGKTTLLKMLNGIFWPDKGKITVRGRVGALIEVGAGFHPLLTGRENVYINAAILGMSKKEVDKKFDDIVKFAEIGDFLDTPVKFYSSGMFVRLGFAVAVHCEPDILLVDEVLAVGDSNFIIKSLNRVSSLIKEHEMTVIFVSHSNTMIRAVCNRGLYLEEGSCKQMGNVEEVIGKYESDCLNIRRKFLPRTYQRIKSKYKAGIVQISLLDENNHPKELFRIGDFMKIRTYISADDALEDPAIQIAIFNEKRECMVSQISKTDNCFFPSILGGANVDFSINKIPLNAGIYSLSVKLIDGSLINTIDYHIDVCYFTIESGNRTGYDARAYFNGEWKISKE